MVFKKKETAEQRKERLERELAETARELEKELAPPPPPPAVTKVHEMKNVKNGDVAAAESFLESVLARYESSFPELGPSGHAHVVRTLLVAILGELKELREVLKR